MTITLSESQRAAITTIKDWYENRSKQQQVCRVFGYAGTGKSTIVRYAIEELGLSPAASARRWAMCSMPHSPARPRWS